MTSKICDKNELFASFVGIKTAESSSETQIVIPTSIKKESQAAHILKKQVVTDP
jgi:hypothetical protein